MEYKKELDYKIEADPYYYELYKEYGWDYIVKAGFIYDNSPVKIEYNLDLLCTPYTFLKPSIKDKKNCIIITTGSMCPLHDGHIEMMAKAKEKLIEEGYNVLGGYISPDHDDYVGIKTHGYMDGVARCNYASKLIKNYDWLVVDPWMAVFNKYALNFTDALERTELYLKKHIKDFNADIVFVCGSDNEKFCLTFKQKRLCVVVNRPSYINVYEGSENTFHVNNDNASSSTAIRKTATHFNKQINLTLRCDYSKTPEFLYKYFNDIKYVYLNDQEKYLEKYNTENVISLDTLIPLHNNLKISRVYDMFGHSLLRYNIDSSKLNYINKKVSLYDDDIVTGNTMKIATKYLKDNYNVDVVNYISSNITLTDDTEVLDSRDFTAFGENNGLVVDIDGNLQRAVYAFPFVDPSKRCSVNEALDFSIDVWEHNLKLFENSTELLCDYPMQVKLYKKCGFEIDTLIKDICIHFINKLKSFK